MLTKPKSTFSEREMLMTPGFMEGLARISELRASDSLLLPPAFRQNPGACLNVAMLAMHWDLPFNTVVQKTYLTPNGKLGFETQLVVTVLHKSGFLADRLKITPGGAWQNLRNRAKEVEGKTPGKTKLVRGWTDEEEFGLSVTVSATLVGEREPRSLTVFLSEVYAPKRFSELWITNPKKQLGYFAVRQWASLHCPEPMMGIVADEEVYIPRDDETNSKSASDSVRHTVEEIIASSEETHEASHDDNEPEVIQASTAQETLSATFREAIHRIKSVPEAREVQRKLTEHRLELGGFYEGLHSDLSSKGMRLGVRTRIEKAYSQLIKDEELTPEKLAAFETMVNERCDHLPVDYWEELQRTLEELRDKLAE